MKKKDIEKFKNLVKNKVNFKIKIRTNKVRINYNNNNNFKLTQICPLQVPNSITLICYMLIILNINVIILEKLLHICQGVLRKNMKIQNYIIVIIKYKIIYYFFN